MVTSLRALSNRADTLVAYLEATAKGDLPSDYRLLRAVSAVCNQLPAVDPVELEAAFMEDFNDSLAVNYLAAVTKSTQGVSDLADKFAAMAPSRAHRF